MHMPEQTTQKDTHSVSTKQVALCLILPAFLCCVAYIVLRPETLSLLFAAGMAAVYFGGIVAMRAACLEQQYKVRLLIPTLFWNVILRSQCNEHENSAAESDALDAL